MSEEVAFEVAPGAFDIVQFGSIFGQPFDGQPRALCEGSPAELAGVDGTIVEHHDDRPCRVSRARTVKRVEPLEQGNEVGAPLGRAAMHDQLAACMVEGPDQRQLARLAGRRDPQVGTAPGPGVRQIGMGQRLGLVLRQQHDVARLGLLLQELEPQPGAIDGGRILSPGEAVARPAPSPAIFFSVLLSCDFEIETSA